MVGDNPYLCEVMDVIRRLYDVRGLYDIVSEGLTGTVGLTGMHVVTGEPNLLRELGHMKIGTAASDARLKEEMELVIIAEGLADIGTTKESQRAGRNTMSMSCHGRSRRRGSISHTSRPNHQRQRGSTKGGDAVRLLANLAGTCQAVSYQRVMDVPMKSWARKLGGPRSTRVMEVAEFEGGINRLGRGGIPLCAWALSRATVAPKAEKAKGKLADLCMAGNGRGLLTVKLEGSRSCLGRPVARREERTP